MGYCACPAKSFCLGCSRIVLRNECRVDGSFLCAHARKLDRGEKLEPSLILSFEDPADFLEVITPARVRLLQEIDGKVVALFALAAALARDPSAVRRDVALLEHNHLVKTRKVPNPGHGMQTVVERAAVSIELAATV